MNLVHQLLKWEHPRHKIFVLILRVLLGVVLTFKGIILMNDIPYLETLMRQSSFSFTSFFQVYYIVFAHLGGGIFIMLGLFTRFAVFIQLPVLVSAVFFIDPALYAFTFNGEFTLSALVLCMLIYFLFKGAGEISMDNYLKNHLA